MSRFTIGDIHGGYLALVQVLERCGFNYETDELIPLGDIVDGWPQSYEVVEELLKIKNRIDIVGNHDDWFLEFLLTTTHPDDWSQGGLGTLTSYGEAADIDFKVYTTRTQLLRGVRYSYKSNLLPTDIPETHIEFFKKQARFYKDDDNNIFVHGGFNRHLDVSETHRDYMMWDRKLWNQALSAKSGKVDLKFEGEVNKVFLGHTTTMAWGSTEPMKASNVWNLDTGAGGPDGKLTIMNIDTEEYWQSDLLSELYPNETNNR